MKLPLMFEVYGRAQTAGSKRVVPWRAKDGRSGHSVVDDNPKSRVWKQEVAMAAHDKLVRLHEFDSTALALETGPVTLTLVFEIPRPKSHLGKKGLLPSAPKWPTSRPDLLKLARAVEDALTGVIWRDDSQIVHEFLIKRYGEAARLTVQIDRVPAVAVPEAAPGQLVLEGSPPCRP